MEYIKFKNQLAKSDILKVLENLLLDYIAHNDTDLLVEGVSNGLLQIDYTLCYIESIKNKEQLINMQNSLIITNSEYSEEYKDFHLLYVQDARYVFIKLLEYLTRNDLLEKFTTALKYKQSFVGQNVILHPSVILEDSVVIEDDVVISAGCVIKNGTYIGRRSIIRENCTIGCDGIALYKAKNGEVLRFPHVAGISIGENVEIGANCVIVRGTLSNTQINNDTVIGNLCNIGHGVKIGKKVWMSVGSMIGGNCRIEDYVTIGLSVSLKDNLFIARESTIGMGSVVTKSILETTTLFGNPAKPLRPLHVGPKR